MNKLIAETTMGSFICFSNIYNIMKSPLIDNNDNHNYWTNISRCIFIIGGKSFIYGIFYPISIPIVCLSSLNKEKFMRHFIPGSVYGHNIV